MARVTIDWYSDDPGMAELLRAVARYPEHSIERLELETVLHEFMATRLREQIGGMRRSGVSYVTPEQAEALVASELGGRA